MRTRHLMPKPNTRPRRIWLNSVGAQNGDAKEQELRKSLPYCDVETGSKNRVVERDPISGLGELGREHDPIAEDTGRLRSARARENRDPICGQGQLGKEASGFRREAASRTPRPDRDPLTNKEATDADTLRPRGKPGKVTIHQAQRDPISGRGEFGKEWDPIHKYSGRQRVWHPQVKDAKRGGRCNPVTGEDACSFEINTELRRKPKKEYKRVDPVTGENCTSYTVSDKLNEKRSKTGGKPLKGGNPLTGMNCKSFDFNVESKPTTPRRRGATANPLTGDNCGSFSYSREFKPRTAKAYIAKNPLTGENVRSFILQRDEKENSKPAASCSDNGQKNPLTGRNCPSFSVSQEERPRTAPPAAAAAGSARCNPVTGENCTQYVLATDERRAGSTQPQAQAGKNPVTGDNVACFDINRELRVNRRNNEGGAKSGNCSSGSSGCTTPQSARSNPITGEA